MSERKEVSPEARKKIIAFQQCFGTEQGTKVLKDLAGYCRLNQPSFIKRQGEPADPLEMSFLDGRKDVLHYIKRILDLKLNPE